VLLNKEADKTVLQSALNNKLLSIHLQVLV